MRTKMLTANSRLGMLLEPVFLLALLLLVLNDHVFKQAYPSWITGKLSDFAGLIVFTVFLYVLLPRFCYERKGILRLHIFTGLAFVVWKIAPVEIVLRHINEATGLPMPGRVKDVTDLIALAVLPLSYTFIAHFESGHARVRGLRIIQKPLAILILLAAGWSIIASNPLGPDELRGCVGIRGNVDGDTLDLVNADDVVYLSDYLYHNGPRPPCLLEADVNCSGDKNPVTEEDLQYLTDFLYNSGPPPCDCP